MYLFPTIITAFVVDDKMSVVAQGTEEEMRKKYPQATTVPVEKLPQALALVANPTYFSALRERNIEITRQALKASVSEDQLIIQAIANLQELDAVCNLLSKRLREWYSWYYPELSHQMPDHEAFAEQVFSADRDKDSMGAELGPLHTQEMFYLAQEVSRLFALRKKHEEYLQKVMQQYCPNLLSLGGVTIAAKLFELAKGLKQLALMPSSTIQILGAEKALFRHLKTGSRSPKHGVIFQHPLLQRAKRENRGKVARQLADKLSLCARLDYFKGEFKAEEYRQQLEKVGV